MAPKAKIPAPIDRPLSRAYLREFAGWSTAYPPGQSEPTSLRIMENTMVNRDGSLRIRPGLRYLSYAESPDAENNVPGVAFDKRLVGTHEAFYLNNGSKAYLFAVREANGTVGFRVLSFQSGTVVHELTDPGIDFSIPQGAAAINFTGATTYVKYLQVDNKIFALSDAGESMRLFYVGAQKSVRKILSIERPVWALADKLDVVHPDAAWITGTGADALRTNLLLNPAGVGTTAWIPSADAILGNTTSPVKSGTSALKITSKPTRKNRHPDPLYDVAILGLGAWQQPVDGTLTVDGSYAKLSAPSGSAGRKEYSRSEFKAAVEGGKQYSIANDFDFYSSSVKGALQVRWYDDAGVQVGSVYFSETTVEGARKVWNPVTAPTGATYMSVRLGLEISTTSAHSIKFKNVMVVEYGEDTTMFHGGSGANYFWEGTPNASPSVYHLPKDVWIESQKKPIEALADMWCAAELRLSAAAGPGYVGIYYYNALGAKIGESWSGAVGGLHTGGTYWRVTENAAPAPAGATHASMLVWFDDLPRGVNAYVDEAILEIGAAVTTYFDGDTPTAGVLMYDWLGEPHASQSVQREYDPLAAGPTAETPTDKTLIALPDNDDEFALGVFYNFAFFYTFENEIGETAASMVTTVKTQRGWSAWRWELPNLAGEPSGTPTTDPTQAADQLVATMPEAVFNAAVAVGALRWNLYMLTWSNQSVVPVTGVLVAQVDLTNEPTYNQHGWAQVTPEALNLQQDKIVPNVDNLRNYSEPSRGRQGLVAADRMVIVDDPTAQAVIRWTSNEQGDYINFTADRGGGYKTLTSGNLMIPSAVKLWQNPQSADTITILCRGTDGHSTAYYMAPAEITSQADATPIMGFEETTATPGTTSPYGCEVFNNSLYHPLDEQLMKSTASNYNINHKSMTDMIEDRWQKLEQKQNIVSSLHDSRIYYIVNNPDGAQVEDGCNGNEIWVFDGAAENGHWSRWLIQAHSLRKIQHGGKVHMSVVRPDGIFYLDPLYPMDDFVAAAPALQVQSRYIPWRIETNTQGANRAHDAWARLQQLDISLGDFQGSMKWGVRSHDLNGKRVQVEKTITDNEPPDTVEHLPFDIHDQLLVKRDLQEWYFFASSVFEDDGVTVAKSCGQINNVQYRYAPVSVNVGYEYGSVETFEYGRDVALADSNTNAGVPRPFNDRGRP